MVAVVASNKKLLAEVTRRIVESVNPQRVLLFGSAVHKRLTKNSDLDMLVVMRGSTTHRRHTAQTIYRNLRGVGVAVDVVVVTEQDVKEYSSKAGTILQSALREGRLLYEA